MPGMVALLSLYSDANQLISMLWNFGVGLIIHTRVFLFFKKTDNGGHLMKPLSKWHFIFGER